MFGFAGIYGSSISGNTAIRFIEQYASAFNILGIKTFATDLSISSGDVLVATGGAESQTSTFTLTKSGGAFTQYTELDRVDYGDIYMGYYKASTSEISTIYHSYSSVYNGGNLLRFRGVRGIGNIVSGYGSGSPSLDITCSAGSTIVVAVTDWSAVVGTQTFTNSGGAGSPTGVTGYAGDGSHFGFAIAYYLNVGVAGVKTVGMSSPTGQKWQAIAFELLK